MNSSSNTITATTVAVGAIIRNLDVPTRVPSIIRAPGAILLGIVLSSFALVAASRLHVSGDGVLPLPAFGIAIAVIAVSFLLMILRPYAPSQLIGFLVLENGATLAALVIAPGLPLILGDPIALRHALQNLVSNAAKYGTEGSNWIGVSACPAGDDQQMVEIRVADRGPGIPIDEQTHIFKPFFRGRRALQDQVHGTGLGLSLVKDIIEAHGGTITVRSESAKGTEFVVRIPVAPPELQDEFAYSAG